MGFGELQGGVISFIQNNLINVRYHWKYPYFWGEC